MGFEVTKVWINVCFYSNWDYSFKVFKWKYECTENAEENSNNQFHLNLAWIQYLLTLIPLLHAIPPSIYIIMMICFYFCTLSGLSTSQHSLFLIVKLQVLIQVNIQILRSQGQSTRMQISLIQINDHHLLHNF